MGHGRLGKLPRSYGIFPETARGQFDQRVRAGRCAPRRQLKIESSTVPGVSRYPHTPSARRTATSWPTW
jgi:hypothetical protein